MVNGITNNLGSNIAAAKNNASENKAGKSTESSDNATNQATSASTDAVSLTESATNLQKLEAAIANMPEVDSDRVAAIKQQVEDGTYEINDERTAAAILGFEEMLAGS